MSKHIIFEKIYKPKIGSESPFGLFVCKEGIQLFGFGSPKNPEEMNKIIQQKRESIEETEQDIKWIERAVEIYKQEFTN